MSCLIDTLNLPKPTPSQDLPQPATSQCTEHVHLWQWVAAPRTPGLHWLCHCRRGSRSGCWWQWCAHQHHPRRPGSTNHSAGYHHWALKLRYLRPWNTGMGGNLLFKWLKAKVICQVEHEETNKKPPTFLSPSSMRGDPSSAKLRRRPRFRRA